MAYVQPTPADLAARFPALAAVPPAALATALNEAATRVDATWTEGDRALGLMLYAAHTLTLDGQGTGAEAALAGAGALGFTSLQSGTLTLSRSAGSGRDDGILGSTTYGRRFLALLKVNQPAVLVP